MIKLKDFFLSIVNAGEKGIIIMKRGSKYFNSFNDKIVPYDKLKKDLIEEEELSKDNILGGKFADRVFKVKHKKRKKKK